MQAMKRLIAIFELFALTLAAVVGSAQGEERKTYAPYVPTSEYVARDICGWTVYAAADLRANPELDKQAMRMITLQLTQIQVLLPENVVKELQKTPIWIQEKDPTYTNMCFHVSREWLETHGVNPDKTNGIDIPNARYYLSEYDRQPMSLLHELAHAFHFKTVENGLAEIIKLSEIIKPHLNPGIVSFFTNEIFENFVRTKSVFVQFDF